MYCRVQSKIDIYPFAKRTDLHSDFLLQLKCYTSVMQFLEGLNDEQKKAVLAVEGPLLIVAGAGAGKTKTIVHRMCYMIEKGIAPSAILAVTFTNKAAKEMRERVVLQIETIPAALREGTMPFVSTFHSLGVFLLRKFGAYDGTVKRFTILDDADTMSLIKESLQYFGLDPKQNEPRSIRSLISRSANAMLSPDQLLGESNPHHRLAGQVWKRYTALKKEQKSLDFDDLLLETVKLLEENETARAWCHETWHYIHIDEYQDTNEVQYRIARALAGSRKNLCVVGDSDQSIYSWRGANIKNILEFERDYPEATVVLLEENYRSTKTVIAAANVIVNKNTYRTPKNLFTNNAEGDLISVYAAYDENDEAKFIVERCIEEIDKGASPDDIAILFRTNFQSRAIEEAFLSYNIPYQVLGVRFFERKEVKDVLSYIRAAQNPDSLVDIKRIINTPARGIGKVTIVKLFSAPSVAEALAGKQDSLSGKAAISVKSFFEMLERIREYSELHSVSETIKFIIVESGMQRAYKEDKIDGEERLENLEELVTLGLRYDHFDGEEGLEKLLEDATLMSDQDNLSGAGAASSKVGVKLMTIHAAKGLEFGTVFVTGLEHGLFPHERDSKLTGADAEEERRLMYVAVTRARRKLFLTYASMRTIFGMRDVRLPSEFLMDVPDEYIQRESRSGESGFTVYL
jgi:DNA helicase-2/ATP-dependent DNA helicase PcrA